MDVRIAPAAFVVIFLGGALSGAGMVLVTTWAIVHNGDTKDEDKPFMAWYTSMGALAGIIYVCAMLFFIRKCTRPTQHVETAAVISTEV